MKQKILIRFLVILSFIFIITNNCKKEDDKIIPNTVTDIDGNIYHTVIIGNQTWMVENLKTTKYNDGTTIPLITDNAMWATLNAPAYCWYNTETMIDKNIYGALYNWYAVKTGKLCPVGWHVPTDMEWDILINYLGGECVAGGKLKEKGTTHWFDENVGASNSSGFTALAGGYRECSGQFYEIGLVGKWWTLTKNIDHLNHAYYLMAFNDDPTIIKSYSSFKYGFSIRCIKD